VVQAENIVTFSCFSRTSFYFWETIQKWQAKYWK